jgi:hypothetical protein
VNKNPNKNPQISARAMWSFRSLLHRICTKQFAAIPTIGAKVKSHSART